MLQSTNQPVIAEYFDDFAGLSVIDIKDKHMYLNDIQEFSHCLEIHKYNSDMAYIKYCGVRIPLRSFSVTYYGYTHYGSEFPQFRSSLNS